MKSFTKKSARYLLSVLVIYALLVAPHEGEFWPFSIYPMFSKAGQPWTRALVRDISSTPDSLRWEITSLENIQGDPVSLQDYGIDPIDFANFVSKTKDWNQNRQSALRHMFGESQLQDEELMVMRVSGQFVKEDSIAIQTTPLFHITADSIYGNPTMQLTRDNLQNND